MIYAVFFIIVNMFPHGLYFTIYFIIILNVVGLCSGIHMFFKRGEHAEIIFPYPSNLFNYFEIQVDSNSAFCRNGTLQQNNFVSIRQFERFSVSTSKVSSTLLIEVDIHDISAIDEGIYTCKVYKDGVLLTDFTVQVTVQVEFPASIFPKSSTRPTPLLTDVSREPLTTQSKFYYEFITKEYFLGQMNTHTLVVICVLSAVVLLCNIFTCLALHYRLGKALKDITRLSNTEPKKSTSYVHIPPPTSDASEEEQQFLSKEKFHELPLGKINA